MIPLFNSKQVREVDHFSINTLGMPGSMLMENAAIEIFNISRSYFGGKFKRVVFICGKGNNGGDGFAAARHFVNAGYQVQVLFVGEKEELKGEAKLNYDILQNSSEVLPDLKINNYKSVKDLKRVADGDIIFDALLGSGASGELRAPYPEIIKFLNTVKAYKVAIDIPTGLNANTGFGELVFNADLTVCLGELKGGLFFEKGSDYCGKVVKGYIGISDSLFDEFEVDEYLLEPEDIIELLPEKQKGGHKYSGGKVLIIAGSEEYPGAAVLTSNSALKSGAGAPVLAFPGAQRKLLSKKYPEVVLFSYGTKKDDSLTPESLDELEEKIQWADVVVIGPGLGRKSKSIAAVHTLLQERKYKRLVIDADGLFALNERVKEFDLKEVVMTPHQAEFASLLGITVDELKKDILMHGKAFVKDTGAYLVLKGAPTLIFLPDGDVLINTTGNPGMAKFGSGDALTGILGSFIAQHKDIEKGIVSGVYLHSLSADLLVNKLSEYSYSATDIIKNFPEAIKFLRRSFA
jgi:ADP-dependent NAD(P)H-hydrate dehydratase / NAD(P)H-hydrate epimerase